ncbi:uncharacterized protein LOC127252151 isoform X2 [Andrographis paniculata]|uniref:uncharacterized protein LOC127252151 isoform X2 n=1 Tax=Andrographis paniculata TaxID=175694 RepID=UPI0021E8D0A7|nr:uncharacterized protein LOC127252151 isoform X2 [Andrographis paniculata]
MMWGSVNALVIRRPTPSYAEIMASECIPWIRRKSNLGPPSTFPEIKKLHLLLYLAQSYNKFLHLQIWDLKAEQSLPHQSSIQQQEVVGLSPQDHDSQQNEILKQSCNLLTLLLQIGLTVPVGELLPRSPP